jgi:hypothetical protein
MKQVFSVFVLVLLFFALVSCGSQASSVPGADVTGKWNAVLTDNGQTSPSYTFGMAFTKNTTTINGTEITYTGGTQFNTGCVNYGNWTATGNTNGGSVITLVVTDPSTNSSFTISGSADSTVTQINGTYTAHFQPNGTQPACADTNGSVVFTRQ